MKSISACLFGVSVMLAGSAAAAVPAKGITLQNGVQVKTIKVGTGAYPNATDTVSVHYRGTLANGTEFDSSYKRGEPTSFPLSQVVPCWTTGIPKIKVGGKAQLTCPSNTAYGERGIPGLIPPNSVLRFEVELLSVD